ncbi:hypothetical protein C451_12150 [Halococcus thailandensis JCM 13552]|uniref:Uncharacterized protein n=1 Tax=Halococcus thailandensis JCM 13552 TaxID=1227457 RepID=M0N425_9EURY|nr:hypothetical protein C451_12150 [Halococcus thailandensis JCM 13552]
MATTAGSGRPIPLSLLMAQFFSGDERGGYMNELLFLAGLAAGIAIGVPALARLWRVDLRGAFRWV